MEYRSVEDYDLSRPFSHDPNFDGVDEDRKCTDVCMLMFFILFLCGMLTIFFISLVNGNPKYLYIPTDHRGLLCGYDNRNLKVDNSDNLVDLTDKPYLFWVRPGKKNYARSFCVSACPHQGLFSSAMAENLKMANNGYKGFVAENEICKADIDGKMIAPEVENYSAKADGINERYFCGYSSKAYFKRCFPTSDAFKDITNNESSIIDYMKNISESSNSLSKVAVAIGDLYNSVGIIALCVFISLVLSFVWLCILRCCTKVFVWISVLLSFAALILLTILCFKQSRKSTSTKIIEGITLGVYSEELNQKVFKVMFIILVILDVIFALIFVFMIPRIVYSIKVIKCVSEMFFSVASLFFFPIFQYIILFIWWIYVIGVATVLFGAGTLKRDFVKLDPSDSNTMTDAIKMEYDKVIQGFSIYHFIGFLWVSFFISALGEMTIAGVVAQYYFASDDDRNDMPRFICLRSFLRSLRFHAGSLALGSLIITVCRLIRLILEFIDEKTKNSQNTVVKCFIKCCKCCCYCLEKFLKYLNRNGYIMTAMHGYSFFKGCVSAFNLLLRNAARATAINWVGDFTLFLGRIVVSAITTMIAILIFRSKDNITFYIVPALCIFVMSWIASGVFTGVFEISIDSMFMCFLEDEERNDGHGKRRPQELQDFLNDQEQ